MKTKTIVAVVVIGTVVTRGMGVGLGAFLALHDHIGFAIFIAVLPFLAAVNCNIDDKAEVTDK